MLYFVDEIQESQVICSNDEGERICLDRALFPADIEVDLPVIRTKNGSYSLYDGPFEGEDGRWWHLVYDADGCHLESRHAPLTNDETKAFLSKLAETNDPKLLPVLHMIIDDLLHDGRTELAQILIERSAYLER